MNAIFDTFKLRAEAVSAEVHRFPGKSAALDFIVQYMKSAGVADSPQAYAVWAEPQKQAAPGAVEPTESEAETVEEASATVF